MEKFIFDSRRKFSDSPKFLKRNHPTTSDKVPACPLDSYLKNKIFVTFDYSYYQDLVPRHASSVHCNKRLNSLQCLIPDDLTLTKQVRQ